MYSSPNYTHYFFEFADEIFIHSLQLWILNPEMLRDYVFGLSDQLVTSVVFPYRELWCIESIEPTFHHCLFFADFGATLWSRIQGYGSRDEFWFVMITMKNRRNEIFGHLQQSCTLKLNIGVPLLVATMLHFVAKIYKLVHACSGIKETISSICWQTIPQDKVWPRVQNAWSLVRWERVPSFCQVLLCSTRNCSRA